MCRQWLLTISRPQNNQLMRTIPIEAYAYCRHLSFPCCFHRHYSFLYSFSWQPLSLKHHFEMQVDRYDTTAYFHLDVDKSSNTSYRTVQTVVTMTISFLPPPMTKHLTIMLICSRRISLLSSSWTHATMIVIGGRLFLFERCCVECWVKEDWSERRGTMTSRERSIKGII
jgi:hypothetical protein